MTQQLKTLKDLENKQILLAKSKVTIKQVQIDWIKHFFNISEEDLK